MAKQPKRPGLDATARKRLKRAGSKRIVRVWIGEDASGRINAIYGWTRSTVNWDLLKRKLLGARVTYGPGGLIARK